MRMRQAQRQMKGTKLQYIGQEPVLFSDVAGVPAAKVAFMRCVTSSPLCGMIMPALHPCRA